MNAALIATHVGKAWTCWRLAKEALATAERSFHEDQGWPTKKPKRKGKSI